MSEILQAKIVDITDDGRSIAKHNGAVYFTVGGVVGDTVQLQITAQKSNYFEAEIVDTLIPSSFRCESNCAHSQLCGGCSLREYSYPGQIAVKEKALTEKIKRALRDDGFHVDKVIRSEQPDFYRNNVQLKCAVKDGNLNIGFFERNSHTVVDAPHCRLLPEIMRRIVTNIKVLFQNQLADKNPYRDVLFDNLQEIMLRTDNTETKVQIIFIYGIYFKGDALEKTAADRFRDALTALLQDSSVVSVYVQDASGKLLHLFGEQFLHISLGERQFRISPHSFFQVNTKQAEKLFTEVREQLTPHKNDGVFDLFCGVGSISLSIAPAVKKIIGIEIGKDAVKNATENARLNHINNAEFIAGDVEKIFTPQFLARHSFDQTKIVVDPPRAGVGKKTLQFIARSNVSKIVYVSCNPATLARDLKILTASGYALAHTTLVDMFPYTSHIETVATLSKLNTEHHLDLEIGEDELSEIDFSKDACYEEIKKFVLGKYGLKVSSLYIAQVKRKHGLIERENYNISKKENQRVPNCPEEKEKAIEDALKYFGMI